MYQHIDVPTKNKKTKAKEFLFTKINELFRYISSHRLIFSFSTRIPPLSDADARFTPKFNLFDIPLTFNCWVEYHVYRKFQLFHPRL